MKTISKLAAVIAATTALTASGAFALGGTGIGTATATVITSVGITQGTGLSFGTFAPDPSGAGKIDSSGNIISGAINKVTNGTPAIFNVVGQAGNNYTIVGDTSVALNPANNGNPVMNAVLTYPSSPRTLNGSGSDSFNVTGVLSVAGAQAADTYTGTYNVSVNY